MTSLKIFAVFLVLISFSFAIQLEKPFEQELTEGETIDLGTIGPGQTVTLEIQPVVESGGIYGILPNNNFLPRMRTRLLQKIIGKIFARIHDCLSLIAVSSLQRAAIGGQYFKFSPLCIS